MKFPSVWTCAIHHDDRVQRARGDATAIAKSECRLLCYSYTMLDFVVYVEIKGLPSFSNTVPSLKPLIASPVKETCTSSPPERNPDLRSSGMMVSSCAATNAAKAATKVACLRKRIAILCSFERMLGGND